jgi:hypothetical protein
MRSASRYVSLPAYDQVLTAVQNEPENSNPTYPTCLMSPEDTGEIGLELRSLMDVTGFENTKVSCHKTKLHHQPLNPPTQIIGFEHNWGDAAAYPVQLVCRSRYSM